MAGGRIWTDDEDADLQRLYPDTSISEEHIAQHFGRTWEGVRIRANRLGLARAYIPHTTWTQAELDDLARMYPDTSLTKQQIEQHFSRNWPAIRQRAINAGLTRDYSASWDEEEEALLRELYIDEDFSQEEICARLNRTWRSITGKANLLGLRRPKPNTIQAKRDYFHTLDTDEKAYWLGFIAADGCVVAGPRKYQIVIDLQPKDLHWVERFRDTIAPGASITKHGERSYSVCISSMELVQDVMRYGIGPRKSNTLEWPQIPEHAVVPFLLGYFDGDGCLSHRSDRPGGVRWSLLGTQPFLTRAWEYIQQIAEIPMREPVRASKSTSPNLYQLSTHDKYARKLDAILNASGLGLPRKHL